MAKRGNNNTDRPKKDPEAVSPAPKKAPAKKSGTNNRAPKKKVPAIAENSSPANKPEQPLTENTMEVHHHPQLDHKPKPWKEYLLEGFMIFIAVMMGFIAENIREDITNHQHATQLTSRLVHDLKVDTLHLDQIIVSETRIEKANDTLIELLQQPLAKVDLKRIQLLIYASDNLWPFYPSSGASNAIKNELHLKQFSDSDIITYISDYEGSYSLLRTEQDVTLYYQHTYLEPFMFDHLTPGNLTAVFSNQPPHDSQVRNLTQEDLTHLAASMVMIRTNTAGLIKENKTLREEAIALLKYVKKTYHPEDK
jgi:hypothetical protein